MAAPGSGAGCIHMQNFDPSLCRLLFGDLVYQISVPEHCLKESFGGWVILKFKKIQEYFPILGPLEFVSADL